MHGSKNNRHHGLFMLVRHSGCVRESKAESQGQGYPSGDTGSLWYGLSTTVCALPLLFARRRRQDVSLECFLWDWHGLLHGKPDRKGLGTVRLRMRYPGNDR